MAEALHYGIVCGRYEGKPMDQAEVEVGMSAARLVDQVHSQPNVPVLRRGAYVGFISDAQGQEDVAFEPGDKVICVDAKGLRRPYLPCSPTEGRVYCVRETYIHTDHGTPVSGLLLVGIFCPMSVGGVLECGFVSSRFRLVHRCGGKG